MLIAFEGPDNVGKTTSADHLDSANMAGYNLTKEFYDNLVKREQEEKGLVHAFDRVDWLTHMTYRLALPDKEWNDARVRTVFAMPELHLVFKLYEPGHTPDTDEEEGYTSGQPTSVNDMYNHMAGFITQLNEVRNFSLFKTVTTIFVTRTEDQYRQRIVDFSSPLHPWGTRESKLVHDDDTLLELLQREDANR